VGWQKPHLASPANALLSDMTSSEVPDLGDRLMGASSSANDRAISSTSRIAVCPDRVTLPSQAYLTFKKFFFDFIRLLDERRTALLELSLFSFQEPEKRGLIAN